MFISVSNNLQRPDSLSLVFPVAAMSAYEFITASAPGRLSEYSATVIACVSPIVNDIS